MTWRTGSKVPINVYDGDRPVCQCQTASDAKLIVGAVNKLPELEAERDALNRELDEQLKALNKLLAVHKDSEAENTALRKALEDAPHGAKCGANSNWGYYPCDCWKSRIQKES